MAGIALYSGNGGQRGFWQAVLVVPLAWLFVFVAARLAGMVSGVAGLQASGQSGRWQDNICALFAWGLVLLALWAWLRWREKRTLVSIGLTPYGGRRFMTGFLLGLVLVVVAIAAGVGLGAFQLNGPGAWYNHLTPTWLFASTLVIIGTILQAVTMEALYRGWVMQSVAGALGLRWSILINSIMFAAIQAGDIGHAPEVALGAVNLALLAWLLSRIAARDDVLWAACGLHAAWNQVMGLGTGLNIEGNHLNVTPMLVALQISYDAPWWLNGGDFGPDGSILATAALLAALLWPGLKIRLREHDHEDDD